MITIETNENGLPIQEPPKAKAVVHKGTYIEYYITDEDYQEYLRKYRSEENTEQSNEIEDGTDAQ
jgi:hypothetical protein